MLDEVALSNDIMAASPPSLEIGAANSAQMTPRSASGAADPQLKPVTDQAPKSAKPTTDIVAPPSAPIEMASESSNALLDFKTGLYELVNSPKPRSSEALPRKLAMFYGNLLIPGYSDQRFSYEELVARYVGLWSVLKKPEAQQYCAQALIGLKLLLSGHFSSASKILLEIEFRTHTCAALTYVMRGVGYFLRSMIILTFAGGYSLFAFSVIRSDFADATVGNPKLVDAIVATVAGMLGSVVSILIRLSEFEATKGRSQMFLTLTGATLPVIGGIFGAFVAALLSSKVVNIAVDGGDGGNVWLYLVIGFLSGFSERFSRGILRIAEDRLGGGDPDVKAKAAPDIKAH